MYLFKIKQNKNTQPKTLKTLKTLEVAKKTHKKLQFIKNTCYFSGRF